ncbi:hypothetical protein D5018_16460 [Parashewanella curva]|uniref:Uncharacterized protein n=1 Tax=Parashewanella curva TaxID=2338552 RepID=A0A3L8PX37_9GAMM|nr:hypothetical protein [Parashewanella curva]RLV58612.1 hypothetical protein D5018_16460 [Parashewanella curva]
MKNQENVTHLAEVCPVKCAVAQVAVNAFQLDKLPDLKELNQDISSLLESLSEHIKELTPQESRALIFALNLAKDTATAKALALASNTH